MPQANMDDSSKDDLATIIGIISPFLLAMGIVMVIIGMVAISIIRASEKKHAAGYKVEHLVVMYPAIPQELLWRVSSDNTDAEPSDKVGPVYLVFHDEVDPGRRRLETDVVGVFAGKSDANLRCLGFAQALIRKAFLGKVQHLDDIAGSWWWTTGDARAGVEFKVAGVVHDVYVQALDLDAPSVSELDVAFSPRSYERY